MKGTLALSWGAYGGFYLHSHRVCLGWVALTYLPLEVEDVMRGYIATVGDIEAYEAHSSARYDEGRD